MEFTLDFIRIFFYASWLTLPLLGMFCFLIFLIGQFVGYLEGWDRFNSFYWSFVTAFTVGYGDMRPTHKLTKVLAILIALLGIMFMGVVVAITVEAAMEAFNKNIIIEQGSFYSRSRY